MDQVFITDLMARGIIGVNDWEREKPQEILINIVLFADLHRVGNSDNIQDSVNYRTVAKKVLAHAETVQRQTVEALAADLARVCLEEPDVQKVRIRVEKPCTCAAAVVTKYQQRISEPWLDRIDIHIEVP